MWSKLADLVEERANSNRCYRFHWDPSFFVSKIMKGQNILHRIYRVYLAQRTEYISHKVQIRLHKIYFTECTEYTSHKVQIILHTQLVS